MGTISQRESNAPDGISDARLARLTMVLLLGGAMAILDGTMVTVGVDTLSKQFDTSISTTAWATTAYLLALVTTVPLTGWASNRMDGRRLWLLGLGIFLAASLASALSWNIGSLIVFRVLQGMGAGILDPTLLTLLARAAGPSRVGRVMGIMGIVLSLGPVLGPVLGGFILHGLDWRWIFLINLPIGAIAFVGAMRALPATPPHLSGAPPRLDLVGLLLLGPGFAAVILSLSTIGEGGDVSSPFTLGSLVVGLALLGCYLLRARRPARTPPVIDLKMFANRGFSAAVLVMALDGAALLAGLYMLSLYYQQGRAADAFAVGLLLAPMGIGSAIAMPFAGRLADRIGARDLVTVGAVVAAAAMVGLTTVGPATPDLWIAAATLVIGLGLGTVGAPAMSSLYRSLPAERASQGSSVLNMFNQLGGALGVAATVLITQVASDSTVGFTTAAWGVAGVIALIALLARLLPGAPAAPTVGG